MSIVRLSLRLRKTIKKKKYCLIENMKAFLLCTTRTLKSCLCHSGHVEAAVKSYKQALLLRPDFPEATCNLLHTLQVTLRSHTTVAWY